MVFNMLCMDDKLGTKIEYLNNISVAKLHFIKVISLSICPHYSFISNVAVELQNCNLHRSFYAL